LNTNILVLNDAHGEQLTEMSKSIAEGVESVSGAKCSLKHINDASRADLLNIDGLILGSPNWSGISGNMKTWLDDQGDLWEEGILAGKIGAAFTTGRGRNSGVEFTLLSLIHWMLAAGMTIVGLPWTNLMKTSGSYYGAISVGKINDEDKQQARILGCRTTQIASALKSKKMN
jgi:NAD(P)H dehydrogenase (quinone)